MLFIVLIWTYTIPWGLMPVMGVWGRFVPEGFLTSCSFDYLTDTNETRIFVATIFTFSYAIPMMLIIYYYSQIVSHVVNHEKALREQAKKMNVDSLRSNANTNTQSAEIRIAKVFHTILFILFFYKYNICHLFSTNGGLRNGTSKLYTRPSVAGGESGKEFLTLCNHVTGLLHYCRSRRKKRKSFSFACRGLETNFHSLWIRRRNSAN